MDVLTQWLKHTNTRYKTPSLWLEGRETSKDELQNMQYGTLYSEQDAKKGRGRQYRQKYPLALVAL